MHISYQCIKDLIFLSMSFTKSPQLMNEFEILTHSINITTNDYLQNGATR